MNEMNIAVEELLAVAIQSQGGMIKIPIDDFKTDLEGKAIAVDSMSEGRVVVLTLVDRDEVNLED